MTTHFGTLAWKTPWMEKPVGYSLWGFKESHRTERLHLHFLTIQVRRKWNDIFQVVERKKNDNYVPCKLPFKSEGEIKTFLDKN